MSTTTDDTCHCLVRHPDKAKFLVVKHEESWAPPTLSFPQGPIEYKANMLHKGMLDKYGLSTRVLRPIVRLPNYHCIEMELASTQPSKKLKAVWVDQAEYARTRTPAGEMPDPFALWFAEQDAGKPPVRRPPFHQPGWFNHADHWIQFQMDSLGIQVTGSVEQYRQGWTSSCLLRVPTNQGWVYFKAGYEAAPGEAVLTAMLASHWPQTIAQPLVIDAKRNWMLNRDFREEGISTKDLSHLPDFARAAAEMQIDSRNQLDELKSSGVGEISMADFVAFCQHSESYRERLQEGGGGLTDDEWSKFVQVLQVVANEAMSLEAINLPLMLVHPDFRAANLVIYQGQHRMLDWSGAVITHPFLILSRILEDHQVTTLEQGVIASTMAINDELFKQISDAYLEPFASFASREELMRVLGSSRILARVWMMMLTLKQLEWVEAMTPHYFQNVVGLQMRAKSLCKEKFS